MVENSETEAQMIDGAMLMAHGDNPARDDPIALEQIASRLATQYPSDVYERFWQGPHTLYYACVFMIGAWLMMSTHSVLMAAIPFLVWHAVVVGLPRFMLGRIAHAPRWAHSAAVLNADETHKINRIVARLGPEFKHAVDPLLPVKTGDRFWIVLKQARIAWKRK